ncbi:MAG: cytochrome c-type biogenesis protein CcmH [Hellea sp.]|nr:cytochrome c-type biogenesis protein CcmH [Hellea sp.]
MIRQTLIMLSVLFAAFALTPVISAQDAPQISEEVVEQRAREVGRQLRCVVCRNLSIEESDVAMAEDMRTIVRAKIRDGASNQQVLDYMQSRYGDFVLLTPPFKPQTYFLWALPFLLLFLAFIWFWRAAKRQSGKQA